MTKQALWYKANNMFIFYNFGWRLEDTKRNPELYVTCRTATQHPGHSNHWQHNMREWAKPSFHTQAGATMHKAV